MSFTVSFSDVQVGIVDQNFVGLPTMTSTPSIAPPIHGVSVYSSGFSINTKLRGNYNLTINATFGSEIVSCFIGATDPRLIIESTSGGILLTTSLSHIVCGGTGSSLLIPSSSSSSSDIITLAEGAYSIYVQVFKDLPPPFVPIVVTFENITLQFTKV